MARRKLGLTQEQHGALGLELSALRNRLQTICIEVSNAYPTGVAAGKHAASSRLIDLLDQLRSDLDIAACEDSERDGWDWTPAIYYPPKKAQ